MKNHTLMNLALAGSVIWIGLATGAAAGSLAPERAVDPMTLLINADALPQSPVLIGDPSGEGQGSLIAVITTPPPAPATAQPQQPAVVAPPAATVAPPVTAVPPPPAVTLPPPVVVEPPPVTVAPPPVTVTPPPVTVAPPPVTVAPPPAPAIPPMPTGTLIKTHKTLPEYASCKTCH
ncbi:hypothetical protein DEALK_00760 [Dehalogenimonas alkenigignens]|uniref:Uncharacterized protein n=1 Tax=Dehalogenimonas alkenigignens TaxID=1217799 RepID=A0A0W0GKS7_9CHLR|nr:hypothetical protein [Dehalogenimonas alkenigignens]KTB49164.1 hypothetical protein DEALK_00760 [Dehalogenimonas alkenigignens]